MPPKTRPETPESAPSKHAGTLVSLGLWVLTVVFAAGIFYRTSTASAEEVKKLDAKVTEHLARDVGPLALERTRVLAESNAKTERALESLDSTVRRIDENMIALCTITKGAQCVRALHASRLSGP